MMKAFLIVTLALFFHSHVLAQSLTPFVVGSSGSSFVSSNGSLSWTVGEVLTATYKTTSYLTQGFHQPASILVTGLQVGEDVPVVVYPNPVKTILHVQTSQSGLYHFELFNLQGQRLIDHQAHVSDITRPHQIDVLEVPVALYILRITTLSSGAASYHKIEKQ